MNRDRTIGRCLGGLLVVAMVLSLLPVFVAPTPAEAAATTSLTVTKYDAHGNVLGTQTVDYLWMEANLPVQSDGAVRYYCQGPTFGATDVNTLWNPSEDVNVGTFDRYGSPKGTDVKDLCDLVGGATAGCTVRIKAADNFQKWFDYDDVYNPEPRQGKLVVTWYNSDWGGYVPDYGAGMRLVFYADTSTNPDSWHVFGDWDMHDTLPESRWHYYYDGNFWPSSSGLSVQMVSNIDIYEPNLISCDDSGNAKDSFVPGETAYVKGLGLAASTSYNLWVQTEPVVIIPGGTLLPGASGHEYLTDDPSGAQETITTDASGDFIPTAIWAVDLATATPTKYDIVADSQALGTIGKYEAKDFVDAPGWQGFRVASPSAPDAAFKADVVTGVAPLTVQFMDQSTENPTAWAWDFDNDGTVDSTTQHPSHTYNTPGAYAVKLAVTNPYGSDSEVKTSFIRVVGPPVAAFAADVVSGTAPLIVQFTDQSTGGPDTWAWDFNNDGTVDSTAKDPKHTYDAAGTYTVKLTATNLAGSDAEVKTDYITATVPTMALLWGPYITGTTTTATVVNVKTTLSTTVTVQYATEAEFTSSGTYNLSATDGTDAQLHHVALSGLDADTVYHYRIVYGTESSADFHLRTFPDSGPVNFVVLSDTQDQLPLFSQSERFKLVADSIAAQPDIAFVLIDGNLVNDASDLANWDRFFAAGRAMLANTTVYTALGNYEGNDALYYDIFGLPEYYSFDCGDAHFTVLDSNMNISAQTTWLDSDLDTSKAWKFVAFHHPLYTSDPNHFGGWANLRSAWEGLFQTHGVDAVWNGHMHAYERYLEDGIQYLVMGTGGAPLYPLGEEKYDGYQNSLENSLALAKATVDPAAETTTVEIIRVADVSADNAEVTTLYPQNTVFETVVIMQGQPAWDLNGDHVCNICDVVVMGLHWGETGDPGWIPEDVNNDGVIDMLDVKVIGLHWGETWEE
ncbi:MAG: PKD domain-containing protein [Dehalococcoidia bacterium]|nr:PKD domain-containing protein [Dehalococcoidia bacterium]